MTDCGGFIKPDVVLYEEGLDNDVISGAVRAIAKADCLIIEVRHWSSTRQRDLSITLRRQARPGQQVGNDQGHDGRTL